MAWVQDFSSGGDVPRWVWREDQLATQPQPTGGSQQPAPEGSVPANITPGPATTPDMLVALAQASMGGAGGQAAPEPWGWRGGSFLGWDPGPAGSFDPNVYAGGPWENPFPGNYQQIPGQNAGVDPNTGLIAWGAGGGGRFYPSPQSQAGQRATPEQFAEWGIQGASGMSPTFGPEELQQILGMSGRADEIQHAQQQREAAQKRQMAINVAAILASAGAGMYFGGGAAAGAVAEAGAGAEGLQLGASGAGFTGGAAETGLADASGLLAGTEWGTDAIGPNLGAEGLQIGGRAAGFTGGAADTGVSLAPEMSSWGGLGERTLASILNDPLRAAGVGLLGTGLIGSMGGGRGGGGDFTFPEPIPSPTFDAGGEEGGGAEFPPFDPGPMQFQGQGGGVPPNAGQILARTSQAAASGMPPSQLGGGIGQIAQQAMDIVRQFSPSFDTTRQFSDLLGTVMGQLRDLPGIHPDDVQSLATDLEAAQLSMMEHDVARTQASIREAANRLGENPEGRLSEVDFATTIARQEIHATARRDALAMISAQQQLRLGQITPELQLLQMLDPFRYFSAEANLFGNVFGTLGGLAGTQASLSFQGQENALTRQFESEQNAANRALQERLGVLDAQTRSRLAEFSSSEQARQFAQQQALAQAQFQAQQQQFNTSLAAQQAQARALQSSQQRSALTQGLFGLGGQLAFRGSSTAEILAAALRAGGYI